LHTLVPSTTSLLYNKTTSFSLCDNQQETVDHIVQVEPMQYDLMTLQEMLLTHVASQQTLALHILHPVDRPSSSMQPIPAHPA